MFKAASIPDKYVIFAIKSGYNISVFTLICLIVFTLFSIGIADALSYLFLGVAMLLCMLSALFNRKLLSPQKAVSVTASQLQIHTVIGLLGSVSAFLLFIEPFLWPQYPNGIDSPLLTITLGARSLAPFLLPIFGLSTIMIVWAQRIFFRRFVSSRTK